MNKYLTRDIIMKLIALLAIAVLMLGSCSDINRWLNLENDHMAEQFAESLIESQLGIEIDLTPGD